MLARWSGDLHQLQPSHSFLLDLVFLFARPSLRASKDNSVSAPSHVRKTDNISISDGTENFGRRTIFVFLHNLIVSGLIEKRERIEGGRAGGWGGEAGLGYALTIPPLVFDRSNFVKKQFPIRISLKKKYQTNPFVLISNNK